MNIKYRIAKKEESYRLAELDYIAAGGATEYLFHDLDPDISALEFVAHSLESDAYPHTYSSVIVAESNNEVIGMSLAYPSRFHCIDDEMRNFFPPDRLEHFREFFSARVEDSYYIDALCVDQQYRSKGIGEKLLEKTIEKAHEEGFSILSLLVYADNHRAIKFYQEHGFTVVRNVELKEHELIPHKGGCLLMKAEI